MIMENLDFQPSIIHKIYDFYKEMHKKIEKFPKTSRYSLGQKIENSILDLLETIYLANIQIKTLREPVLHKASAKCELVKILIRLAYDTGVIDNTSTYVSAQAKMQEIGKMLGGWIKYMRNAS
ncbi:MAG: hypothetical protein A2639_02865 [Candidatus Staskawiczbacteria bacterium RIFCSPHIGHO2_01_FULL_34_27]|uniref:bAvd-like domain-containing protein n=2 Tax=Candidatus Staskawicziibacteriota TaxID=1817916 RepID=A0A1G2HKS1_9BACT|nr:MAG: hypothetical protein A2639_02865 [Candidatus Staskawiczbacteria bacterium RIFCSPHIGHO2_01_FULL_34_27]OGZ65788.1 MAG: hypothetical protein A3D34_00575 [Candidatus Staskawiczbacteria bacterium RIFCSPHIGHO2_02_FULL_33_16]